MQLNAISFNLAVSTCSEEALITSSGRQFITCSFGLSSGCHAVCSFSLGLLQHSHPLPSPFFPMLIRGDRCLLVLNGGSQLSCRDCQPWKQHSVQGPAGCQWRPLDILGTQPYTQYSNENVCKKKKNSNMPLMLVKVNKDLGLGISPSYCELDSKLL